MNLQALQVRLVRPDEAERYQALMQVHHYLGALVKIGENLWYVVTILDEWVALVELFLGGAEVCYAGSLDKQEFQAPVFSPHNLTNNSRFLLLPEWHYPNLASKALSLCLKRLSGDWQAHKASLI